MSKLILGCGYFGYRVALEWKAAGDDFFVMTRNQQQAEVWQSDGFNVIVADLTKPETLQQLPEIETVLYSLGYDRSSESSIAQVFQQAMTNAIAHLSDTVKRFIYISTTGVYGQTDGSWVDEQSPCEPQSEGAKAHLATERLLLESSFASRSIILRLGGMYGPDRLPRQADLIAANPIPVPAEGYLNLIHVNDAVQVVQAAEVSKILPQQYVVCDNCPTKRVDYLTELSRLLNAPEPTFEESLSSNRPQRGLSNKRVRNTRMLQELKVQLLYPSYKEGLAAIVGK